MKLYEIWNAKAAWTTLSALKKNPKLAYRLMKYEKKVDAELDVCNAHRERIVYQCAGLEPPSTVSLAEGTPEFTKFLADFNVALDVESDLTWSGVTMDELIEALGAQGANVISESELELLEPFFESPAEPVAA